MLTLSHIFLNLLILLFCENDKLNYWVFLYIKYLYCLKIHNELPCPHHQVKKYNSACSLEGPHADPIIPHCPEFCLSNLLFLEFHLLFMSPKPCTANIKNIFLHFFCCDLFLVLDVVFEICTHKLLNFLKVIFSFHSPTDGH